MFFKLKCFLFRNKLKKNTAEDLHILKPVDIDENQVNYYCSSIGWKYPLQLKTIEVDWNFIDKC